MESKKVFLYVIFLFSFLTFNCHAQQYGWVELTSPNENTAFRKILLIEQEAWLLGNDNIYHSNNFPLEQFSSQYAGLTTYNDLFIKSYNGLVNGWAVGYDSYGAKTTDGINWTAMYLSGISTFNCVSFPTSLLGFASGGDGRLHKTTNGGIDWFDTGVNLSNGSIYSIVFIDTMNGYISGGAPAFRKTTDGGANWSSISGYTGTINDIFFLDENNAWAVGALDIIIYNGSNWIRQPNPSGNSLNSVFFVNQLYGWVVGNNGTIIQSTDGGTSWSTQESGTTETLRDVFFTSPTNGFAVGNNGTILHYTLLTDVEEQPTQPTEFKLEQNYPNPFNPTTKIKFTIPTPPSSSPLAKGRSEVGLVTLKVFDVLGNEIATLVNEEKAPGTYEVEFQSTVNSLQLASGIFYYQLKAGEYLETKKMILLK